MPAARDDEVVRRGLVPPRVAGSLWGAAAWTGVGTALVAGVIGVLAVAVLWLPAAGAAGNANSAVRAGLLTFLSGLHGGVTVDGLSADFVPLGLTLAVAGLAWRAGAGLADVADDLGERDPRRLLGALAVQALAFAVACSVLGRLATLGTSGVPGFGVAVAAFVLFGVVAGGALVTWSALRADVDVLATPAFRAALRGGLAVLAVYLLGGSLLTVASLVTHHSQVTTLSGQIGGGLAGVPVLLLGALAAPNAAIAGSIYLAGPGFAVGTGNGVSLWSGAHGTIPAFPVLGALPAGPAGVAAWLLAVLTLLGAGSCVAVIVDRASDTWRDRLAGLVRAGGVAGGGALVLAWQGGGAIGSGHLSAVGASAWQAGLAFAAVTVVGGSAGLLAQTALRWLRRHQPAADPFRALADRANAAAERLEATHSQVERTEHGDGVLRATLRSVAAAVTVTDDERRQHADVETTAPIPRVRDTDADKRAG